MAVIAFNSGLLAIANGSIAWATDDVYAVLLGNGYTPSLAHDTYSDVSAQEIADADYARVALTSKTVALSGLAVVYDAADVSFGEEVTISARYVVFVKGAAASPQAADPLVFYNDLGALQESTDSQFIVRTTNGIYQIAPAA